ERQTRTPDVVVVTDGGSVAGTTEILRQFASHTRLPLRWQGVPGNRSQGRNAAIRLADADLIAVTDVNIVEPEWFERIIAPLECGKADVVGGWYEPLGDTPRERALGAMTLFSLRDIRPDSFVPASRSVAFTREAWRRVGGYDERLATAEDTGLALVPRRHQRPISPSQPPWGWLECAARWSGTRQAGYTPHRPSPAMAPPERFVPAEELERPSPTGQCYPEAIYHVRLFGGLMKAVIAA